MNITAEADSWIAGFKTFLGCTMEVNRPWDIKTFLVTLFLHPEGLL